MKTTVKRGVSLYSFQEEMFLGRMDIEQCVAFAASIGAKGIENMFFTALRYTLP